MKIVKRSAIAPSFRVEQVRECSTPNTTEVVHEWTCRCREKDRLEDRPVVGQSGAGNIARELFADAHFHEASEWIRKRRSSIFSRPRSKWKDYYRRAERGLSCRRTG
jgi:hypothetical protein